MYLLHNHISNRVIDLFKPVILCCWSDAKTELFKGIYQNYSYTRSHRHPNYPSIIQHWRSPHTHTTLIYFCIRQSGDDGDAKCLYLIHHTDKWEVDLRSGHTFSRQQKIHLVFRGDFLAKLVNWRQDWIGPLSELPLLVSCDGCVCLPH